MLTCNLTDKKQWKYLASIVLLPFINMIKGMILYEKHNVHF